MSRYKGEKRRGLRHGKGVLYYEDGSRYEGLFIKGKRHGKGTYHSPSGGKFVGMFKNDQMVKGTYYIPENGRYEGEMKDECPHGQGTFFFKNGVKYEGEWKDGMMHGTGRMSLPNGTDLTGPFVENKKHGRFMREEDEGDTAYEGEYKNNELVGEWKCFARSYNHTTTILSDSSTSSEPPSFKMSVRRKRTDGRDGKVLLQSSSNQPQVQSQPQPQPQSQMMMTPQLMMMSPEQRMSMMMNVPQTTSQQKPARVVVVDDKKRYAFLIGQNQGKLRYCQDDALRMERKLKQYGYQCYRYSDVDYARFRKYFNRFSDIVKPQSKVIVYYSGHGYMKEGQNYLCCFKEDKYDDDMKLSYLIKKMRTKNCLNFFFLDCCQKSGDGDDESYKAKAGGSGGGNPISINANANDGQFVFGYACLPGLVSYEKLGGVYTKYLMSHMDQQTEIIKVLKLTARDLKMNEKQSGYYASTAYDDLYV